MIVWQSPAIEHSIAAVIVVNERDTTTTTTSLVTSCAPLRRNLEKSSFQSLKTSLLNDHSVIGSQLLPTTYLPTTTTTSVATSQSSAADEQCCTLGVMSNTSNISQRPSPEKLMCKVQVRDGVGKS